MKRLRVKPRENYEERLTEVGFNYYNLKTNISIFERLFVVFLSLALSLLVIYQQ